MPPGGLAVITFLCKISRKARQTFHLQMESCLAPRKYAQAYESNYMTEQLGKLIMSISKHVSSMRKAEGAVAKHLVSKCRIFMYSLQVFLCWGSVVLLARDSARHRNKMEYSIVVVCMHGHPRKYVFLLAEPQPQIISSQKSRHKKTRFALVVLVFTSFCRCLFWYAMFHLDHRSRLAKSFSWTSKDSDSSLNKDLLGACCFLSWVGSIMTGTAHRLQGINSGVGTVRCTRRFLMCRLSDHHKYHRVSFAFCGQEMFLTDSW